ncbi:MAG: VOC family protein [Defluviitaleaceae bacterium]|nr:VOC family protein [Defluviitaleaceae bacterium]
MITGVELSLVVHDSVIALELYKQIFEVDNAQVTEFEGEAPEAVFHIYNGRYRLVKQKAKYRWYPPIQGANRPMWVNVSVLDIQKTFDAALAAGCDSVRPVTEIPGIGLKIATFEDPIGHMWMLQEAGGIMGTELFMVVSDSVAALDLYKQIFDVNVVDVSNLEKGQNEAIFHIYNGRFHLVDENRKENVLAPKEEDTRPLWVSIAVNDIQKTFDAAMALGCVQISPIGEIVTGSGVKSASFGDSFGYMWTLYQIDKTI